MFMRLIAFEDTKVRTLIEKSLTAFYELTQGEQPDVKELDDLLKLYNTKPILYVSEWLDDKGLETLKQLYQYDYENNEEYQGYIDLREMILEMDVEAENVETLFISFTELINSALDFAQEYGLEKVAVTNKPLTMSFSSFETHTDNWYWRDSDGRETQENKQSKRYSAEPLFFAIKRRNDLWDSMKTI